MRFRFWRRPHLDEAEALEETIRNLNEVKGQWPRVEEAVETMRVHRKRNHFAETIEAIYVGRNS